MLIGRGKTNGEIAAELFVSEGTVKTHINHLFTKPRLRDRAAAVVFAFDHDLGKHPDKPDAPRTSSRRWHVAVTSRGRRRRTRAAATRR